MQQVVQIDAKLPADGCHDLIGRVSPPDFFAREFCLIPILCANSVCVMSSAFLISFIRSCISSPLFRKYSIKIIFQSQYSVLTNTSKRYIIISQSRNTDAKARKRVITSEHPPMLFTATACIGIPTDYGTGRAGSSFPLPFPALSERPCLFHQTTRRRNQ